MDSSSEGLVEKLDFVRLGSLQRGLGKAGLREAVRATCYGIQMSVANSTPPLNCTAQPQGCWPIRLHSPIVYSFDDNKTNRSYMVLISLFR